MSTDHFCDHDIFFIHQDKLWPKVTFYENADSALVATGAGVLRNILHFYSNITMATKVKTIMLYSWESS